MDIDILEKSKEFMREGRFEKAQIILRRALEENPNRARILELCGDLSVKLGRTNEAVARYEHAYENYTHSSQYAEAIVCLEKILKISPLSDTVLFRLVDLYRFYGLPNEAIKKLVELSSWALEKKNESLFVAGLRKIIEQQPKNLALRLSFTKLLLSINRAREAHDEMMKLKGIAEEVGDEGVINEIKKLLPQHDGGEELDPKSRVELGNLLYEIGSKDEAIVEFNKAASDLIQLNRKDEAISVLNRIIEIDPNNSEALGRIKALKGSDEPAKAAAEKMESPEPVPKVEDVAQVAPEVVEAMFKEAVVEPPVEQKPVEVPEVDTAVIQSDLDILKDLSKEIEGFSISGNFPVETEQPVADNVQAPVAKQAEEMPPLEGQIADIEFLLKEAEAPAAPSFELAKQFDEFRSSITWETDDVKKKVDLALMAYEAELYETALAYIKDDRDNKNHWPMSIEIIGGSLIKLGKYNEAIKTIGPMILLEEIPEKKKIEMRYLLASAYEGVGDFENALREIEHIMAANPDYRDVREVYELLGGKIQFEKPMKPITESPEPEKITAAVEGKLREDKLREERLHEEKLREERLTEERMREEKFREEQMREQRLYEEKMHEVMANEAPVIKPDIGPEVIMPTSAPDAAVIPKEETYTTIIDEPLPKEKPPAKEFVKEKLEVQEKGENIAFL